MENCIFDIKKAHLKYPTDTTDELIFTEDKGFEPSRRANGLTHFECAPFDHLGNPPLKRDPHYTGFDLR